jgi:hypothetical protein
VRARDEAVLLEVDEELGVLLGLLGDAVDGHVRAGRHVGQRRAGRASLRRPGVDRVAVRARRRVADQRVDRGFHTHRDLALQAHRLLVRLGPAEADHLGQQPLQQRMPSEDDVGQPAAFLGHPKLALGRSADRHEPFGDETADHL